MEAPTRRRRIVFYLQVAAAIVSLILGLAQMTKESAPIVEKYQNRHQQSELQKKQQEAQSRAAKIAAMNLQWQYRGNDGTWRFYSDVTNSYWCRVNIQGTYEYAENPALIASNQRKAY